MRAHVFLVLAAMAAATVAFAEQTVTGKVTKVRDADTVVVNGVPIRLNGVDAPENGSHVDRMVPSGATGRQKTVKNANFGGLLCRIGKSDRNEIGTIRFVFIIPID
ncbi:MAG: hypothetical protein AAGD92_17120 [Pseudomonadota bacterium]